jgi:putative thioredoxin
VKPVQQAADQFIVEVTEQNLQSVLEQSMQVPVIIDFWAEWCEPCKQMAPMLEKLVREQQGGLILAKVNADTQAMIAQQLQVQSLPNLKLVYQGRIVSELTGAQTEARLKEWLAPVLGGGEEDEQAREDSFIEQIRMAINAGQGEQAEQALRQTLQQAPDKHRFRAVLVEYLLSEGRLDDAQSVLAEVTEDVEELRPFRARFALLEELEDAEPVSLNDLAVRIREQATPEDLYAYGLRAAAAGHFQEGLEALIRLLADHKHWQNGAAREALLKVFDCLPKGDPLASEYRRRMFNHLY